MSRAVPEHGTYARARGSKARPGCDCTACTVAERRYDKGLRYSHARGQRRYVPAEPVRELLSKVRATGTSWQDIAAVTGIGDTGLHRIVREQRPTVRSSTARSVLKAAVLLEAPARTAPVVGATRRIQALMALGHPLSEIAAVAGLNTQDVSEALNQRFPDIQFRRHECIAHAYNLLWRSAGTSRRSLNRARREGWAGPLQWNDDSIDDPAMFPNWTGHCGSEDGWLLHVFDGTEPCNACAPHTVDLQSGGVSRRLAASCGQAVLAIAADGCGWKNAGHRLGVGVHSLEYAHRLVRESRRVVEEAAA